MTSVRLDEMLENAARQFPNSPALLSSDGTKISYRKYFDLALEFAGTLNREFPKATGICLLCEKSIASLILIQGILRSGACYVPLQSDIPLNEVLTTFENSTFDLLITTDTFCTSSGNGKVDSVTEISVLDRTFLVLGKKKKNAEKILQPDNLAYILHTSGSTGTPKGVMMTHDSVMSFVQWSEKTFRPTQKETFASVSQWTFDLSILDIFLSIRTGCSLLVLNNEEVKNVRMAAKLFADHRVTQIYATPTFFKLLVEHGRMENFQYPDIQRVLFAGEVFPIKPLNALRGFFANATFYNLYGPTETNVCTYYKLPKEVENDRITPYPIGKACENTNIRTIKDEKGSQLLVSGPSVSAGYYNNLTETEKAFEVDSDQTRWYRTGDYVFLNKHSEYEFVGRKDGQIKRNGYRIELGEIEQVLSTLEQVLSCAVIKQDNDESIRIVAFIQPENGSDLNPASAKAQLAKKIGIHKLPDRFIIIDNIPLTESQKIDYTALRSMTDIRL